MKKLIDIARLAVWCALFALIVSVILMLHTASKHLNAVLMQIADTAVTLNKPKVGPLALMSDDLRNLRLGLDNANKVAIEERFFLEKEQPAEIAKVNKVLDSSREAIDSLEPVTAAASATLKSTQETVQALQPTIAQATETLQAAQSTTAALGLATSHLDALLSDPDITATIAHTDSTMGHLDATSADVQQEVHSITHPTLLHKAWGVVLDVAHVFNPL